MPMCCLSNDFINHCECNLGNYHCGWRLMSSSDYFKVLAEIVEFLFDLDSAMTSHVKAALWGFFKTNKSYISIQCYSQKPYCVHPWGLTKHDECIPHKTLAMLTFRKSCLQPCLLASILLLSCLCQCIDAYIGHPWDKQNEVTHRLSLSTCDYLSQLFKCS